MKVSEYALKELADLVCGKQELTTYKSGPQLVTFLGRFGIRDVYDSNKGGFPKIDKKIDRNLSRPEYVRYRLQTLNDSPKLKELVETLANENSSNKLVTELNKILNEDGLRVDGTAGKYFITGHNPYPEEVTKEVHFEDIQKQILAELDKAKFFVQIAVAWFTDPVLFSKLKEKKEQGVTVQLIIIDDDINRNSRLDFEKEFEIHRIPPNGYDKMHNKFCIIDLIVVINGSYNWTKQAQWNHENITIDTSRDQAERFAQRFIALKKGN